MLLKWYKNGGRGNGVMGFACAREKVRQVPLFPTTTSIQISNKSVALLNLLAQNEIGYKEIVSENPDPILNLERFKNQPSIFSITNYLQKTSCVV